MNHTDLKKRKIIDIPFNEKLKFFLAAIKEHQGLIALGASFQIGGLYFVYWGWISQEEGSWIPCVAGGSIFAFITFSLGVTLPSSISYYYEKSLSKKYGFNLSAIVTDKRIEDDSYNETIGSREKYVEEIHYIVGYKYEYEKEYEYEYEFFLDKKEFYEKIEIGSEIPIRLLKFKPGTSFPRRIKLGKKFGFKKSECN